MTSGNHAYRISTRGIKFGDVTVYEPLPQSLVDEVRLRLNQLALDIIVTYIRSKRPGDNRLAALTGLPIAAFGFVIEQEYV